MVTKLLGVWLTIDFCLVATYAYFTPFWKIAYETPSEDFLGTTFSFEMYDASVEEQLTLRTCDAPPGLQRKLFYLGLIVNHLSLLGSGVYFSLKLREVNKKVRSGDERSESQRRNGYL